MVFHYTKCANLESIVLDSGIRLKASHYKKYNLNDYEWAKRIATKIIEDICKEQNKPYDPDMQFDPFVISFSCDMDSPRMWGCRFGDNGRGIMLGFDEKVLLDYAISPDVNPDVFMKCKYSNDRDEIKQWLLECKENSFPVPSDCLQDDLMLISAYLLNPRYKKQREYRYVIPVHPGFFIFREEQDQIIVEEEIINTDDKDVFFPKSSLKMIMLGNKCSLSERYVSELLNERDYDVSSVIIKRSQYN